MTDDNGARVLVVDDDPAVLQTITGMLADHGYMTEGATNGSVALDVVLGFRPQVVVFDFWMPVADGRDLVQGLRELAPSNVGLVAMSGTAEVEDWCGRVGVGSFVRKPFQEHELLSAVVRAVEEAKSPSARVRTYEPPTSSRRLSADRAALIVGGKEEVRSVRALLRNITPPLQVAVVEGVQEAIRAIGSIAVDVIAVCGSSALRDSHLPRLVALSSARGVPVVLEAHPSASRFPPLPRLHPVCEPGAPALVEKVTQLIGAGRGA